MTVTGAGALQTPFRRLLEHSSKTSLLPPVGSGITLVQTTIGTPASSVTSGTVSSAMSPLAIKAGADQTVPSRSAA